MLSPYSLSSSLSLSLSGVVVKRRRGRGRRGRHSRGSHGDGIHGNNGAVPRGTPTEDTVSVAGGSGGRMRMIMTGEVDERSSKKKVKVHPASMLSLSLSTLMHASTACLFVDVHVLVHSLN